MGDAGLMAEVLEGLCLGDAHQGLRRLAMFIVFGQVDVGGEPRLHP